MPKVNKRQVGLPEVFKHYKETVEDPVSYKEHKAILDLWGEKVVKALLDGKDIKLFAGLASLGIRKKIKRTYIDRKASKEAGKEIRRSNSHSGFYGAKVYWRRHYTAFNSAGWVFQPSRSLQRGLSAIMQSFQGHLRYFQKAMAVSNSEQSKSVYNKKVLGL